jgi:broad specificity phosphatase PhoE
MDYILMSYLMIIKVSILVREWAVGRWEEGEQASLAEELPAIHPRNREEWELQAAGGEEDEH